MIRTYFTIFYKTRWDTCSTNHHYVHNQDVCVQNEMYKGWSKTPCQHLFFSSYGCIYTKVTVSTSSMNLCLLYLDGHTTWYGHYCTHGCTAGLAKWKCILDTANWVKLAGNLNCKKTTSEHFNKTEQLNDVQILSFLYKDTLLPIRLKSCAIWQVWDYPLRVEQTFSTPQI